MQMRRFPWIVIGVLLLLTPLAAAVAYWSTSAAQAKFPPPCDGLGWGCTPGPDFSAWAAGLFWLVITGVAAILMGVSEFFWERVAVARSMIAVALLGLGVCLLLFTAARAAIDSI
jgi:hypothetical protein